MRLPSLLDTPFLGHGADRHDFRPVSILVSVRLRGKAQYCQDAEATAPSHGLEANSAVSVAGPRTGAGWRRGWRQTPNIWALQQTLGL